LKYLYLKAAYLIHLCDQGKRGQFIPSAATEHLVNAYKYVGMMMAHAAKNGCRGLPGLSPAIRHYVVHGDGPSSIDDIAHVVSIDDVADTGLRNLLVEVSLTRNRE